MNKEFAGPPKKGMAVLLADNNIVPPAPKVKTEMDILLDQVAAQEAECLKTIHTRYCIIKMLPINIADVQRYQPSKKQAPHYYEYWYKFGTKAAYMLMSRNLIPVEPNGVELDIQFNKELIREGE